MVCCQLCLIILARSCADSPDISLPPSSNRSGQEDDHMFHQEIGKTNPPLWFYKKLAAKGKKINHFNCPFSFFFFFSISKLFLYNFVMFISNLLYLLHLLWIVISYCFVVLSREGNVRKSMFGFFCTVKVLFTLGAYLIQLFNKVFGFISSIGTHGIYICVVWSCIFFVSAN